MDFGRDRVPIRLDYWRSRRSLLWGFWNFFVSLFGNIRPLGYPVMPPHHKDTVVDKSTLVSGKGDGVLDDGDGELLETNDSVLLEDSGNVRLEVIGSVLLDGNDGSLLDNKDEVLLDSVDNSLLGSSKDDSLNSWVVLDAVEVVVVGGDGAGAVLSGDAEARRHLC
ncbi:hypothetical protein F4818DRAFT_441029 [Hypoxylon cercidicola]|nr:hypothetical protein F4818DRAFT_441029 [Hypoxylon cercidicola]